MASLGAVAGPLAGARAPQRVSTPPSSGLAAVLPWPSPASPRPRLGFFSRTGEKVHPTHPNPNAFFPFLILSLFFSGLSEWEKLGLGLGFVLADSISLLSFLSFSFIRMENWD